MNIDALLNEAEDKLRMAGNMVNNQQDPAVITALATYSGACATLAGARLKYTGPPQETAQQTIQETLDAETLPDE